MAFAPASLILANNFLPLRVAFCVLKLTKCESTNMFIGNNLNIMTPCINQCELDNADTCKGCFRTASEITDWVNKSEEDKLSITIRCKKMIAGQA